MIRRNADATFDNVLAETIWEEGGTRFVLDSQDRGGATRHGISLSYARYQKARFDIDGDGDVDEADIRQLPFEVARQAYLEDFWNGNQTAGLPPYLRRLVFDMSVNQGVRAAARTLQRSLRNVAVDGIIGVKTLGRAMRHTDPAMVIVDFQARRCKKYAETYHFQRYGYGWLRRAARVHHRTVINL